MPSTTVVAISGRIARSHIPKLCERVRALLEESDIDLVVCDVGALIAPDAVAVDALARLQLTAGRLGSKVRLLHACDELEELIALMGLREVVSSCAELPVEPGGQTEQRKKTRSVKEERDPRDLPA